MDFKTLCSDTIGHGQTLLLRLNRNFTVFTNTKAAATSLWLSLIVFMHCTKYAMRCTRNKIDTCIESNFKKLTQLLCQFATRLQQKQSVEDTSHVVLASVVLLKAKMNSCIVDGIMSYV